MPRTCSLCTHPDRFEVEAALRAGTPLRTIAARWSVSKTALLRHSGYAPPLPGTCGPEHAASRAACTHTPLE